MTPPKKPISDWTSPAVILAIAAMALTGYTAYNVTQTGYDVRISKLELRTERLETDIRRLGDRP